MGKKRTEREAEVELAQNAGSINNNDLELKLVNGDRDEKRKEKKKKKKKEERSERVVEAQDAEKSRPEIESEVVNSDSKDKKKKKEKLKERNGAVSNELPTVSIALPGSIIDNAQSLELATRVYFKLLFQFTALVVSQRRNENIYAHMHTLTSLSSIRSYLVVCLGEKRRRDSLKFPLFWFILVLICLVMECLRISA